MPEIESGKSKGKRKTNTKKAISLLDELNIIGKKKLISNFSELRERLSVVSKCIDAIDCLDKADKQYFLENTKQEEKYLLEALYHLKMNHITKKEFNDLKAKSEITSQIWSVSYLRERLVNIGYVPSKG